MPGTAANIRREDQRKNVIVKQLNFLQLCTSMLFSASFIDVEIHRPIKLAQMTEVKGCYNRAITVKSFYQLFNMFFNMFKLSLT